MRYLGLLAGEQGAGGGARLGPKHERFRISVCLAAPLPSGGMHVPWLQLPLDTSLGLGPPLPLSAMPTLCRLPQAVGASSAAQAAGVGLLLALDSQSYQLSWPIGQALL